MSYLEGSMFSEDSYLLKVKNFISEIKQVKEENKASVVEFTNTVPKEHFEFICFREDGLFFSAFFNIINSDYVFVVRSVSDLRVYSKSGLDPLSDNKQLSASLYSNGIPLEEALSKLPKKAGSFLCFNMDVIQAKATL